MKVLKNLRNQARDYGVPLWKLPDVLLIMMTLVIFVTTLFTYWWISSGADDPSQIIISIAVEAVLILVIGNIIVETSKDIIDSQKLKKEFINIISHQMRSPLTISKWSLEMIKRGELPEKEEKYVNKTIEANKRMLSIVNDFVHLARMADELKEIESERIDIVKLVKKSINDAKFFSEAQKVKIEMECKEKELFIEADKQKTEVIFDNLIDNALKYSPANTKIKIKLSKKSDNVVVEIKDKGIGIKKEDRKFIFTKFYRSADARRSCSSGTGIGLFVSRAIAEKMDGTIWFESREGFGTSFFVQLPLSNDN